MRLYSPRRWDNCLLITTTRVNQSHLWNLKLSEQHELDRRPCVANQKLWLYSLSSNCHTCPYERVGSENDTVATAGNVHIINTKYSNSYRLRTNGRDTTIDYDRSDTDRYCDVGPVSMGEFGIYEIQALQKSEMVPAECKFTEIRTPVNIYYPFLIAFLVYLAIIILFNLYKFLFNRHDVSSSTTSSASTSSTTNVPPPPPPPHIEEQYISSSHPGGPTVSGLANLTKRTSISGSQISIASNRSSVVSAHPPISEYSSYSSGEAAYKVRQIQMDPAPGSSKMEPRLSNPNIQIRRPSGPVTGAPPQPSVTPAEPRPQLQRQRLQSLDTFRGICIVIMIFVNDGGGGYYFLEHATWDGLYVADLVFPWFLWIMGVCIPMSIKSARKRDTPRLKIFTKILIRSLKLISIGIILASFGQNDLDKIRLPGVLQRFGICYFVCSTLCLLYMNVNFSKPAAQNKFKAAVQDVEIIWIGWVVILLFVMVHCLLTFFLTVPGCPTGYLGPGGLHENGAWSTLCIGGASGYIDRQIFTDKHIYGWPTANEFYAEGRGKAYDPEGLLGTLNSFLQVWLGVQTGVTMLVYPKATSRIKRWLSWATVLGAAGALLCQGKEYGGWIPVNKNLWSLSFVLVTCSFALILLSFLYFIIDMKKWWSGTPFYEPGMNSILLYVGHSIGSSCLPFHWKVGRMETHAIKLFESLWGTTLWVLVAIRCHIKKFYWVL
ncbi:unnamed protein product [Allacma fusca]|uniref:Heparan-alpha-glucosaminide N-acetyltransferase n=1 Tax=Allacma fusca TaxID=39272 RepID=A0A8J2P9B4_9HEXA|nr:unnamed protein product [Allacma fusca]